VSWLGGAIGEVLGTRVTAVVPVAGGDINDAHHVRLVDGRALFVKSHADPPPGMYAAEAAGLDWLRAGIDTVAPPLRLRVPRVVAVAPDDRWLALEWLELGDTADEVAFGRALAALHQSGAPQFGFARESFLATISQQNTPTATWPEFYVEHRLRPMIALGIARGRIDPAQLGALDRLRARIDDPDVFGPPEPPARLHGDLWWGNVRGCDGVPTIFDPAVYGGHREIDLAMLALFGGIGASFVRAYREVYPLAPDRERRVALYQAYPIATHAVLFGGGYAASLARTLATF
jgi:fructosamine-3-kinase